MNQPNLSVVKVKAFVPAQDFARSKALYQALGFTRASVVEDIAYFHCGESSFLASRLAGDPKLQRVARLQAAHRDRQHSEARSLARSSSGSA